MADLSKVEAALIKADAAGDVEGARILAGEVRRLRGMGTDAPSKPEPVKQSSIKDFLKPEIPYGDIAAGALRGAASIGSTILAPFKAAFEGTGQTGAQSERGRILNEVDQGLQYSGADPSSIAYQGGKLGAEIAGTSGAGGILARGVSAIPTLARFAPVVESGGFNLGRHAATGLGGRIADAATRAGAGAIVGGTAAGMVDPSSVGVGGAIGAAAPGAIRGLGMAGDAVSRGMDWSSRKLMTSALKPTIEMHRKGQAAKAVQTMLDEGVSPTRGGLEKLRSGISQVNDDISNAISGSDATISKMRVASYLDGMREKFIKQANPTGALNAIDNAESGWLNHPLLGGGSSTATKGQSIFVDSNGNVLSNFKAPEQPKLRSLLDEIKRAGGISVSESSDIGMEKLSKNYPGIMRKDGGMKMDKLVEWLEQNGWMNSAQLDDLERNAVGGSHEYARDMLRSAFNREDVIHPAQYDAYANYWGAMKDLDAKGIKQIKIPGTEKALPSDFEIPVQLAQDLKKGTYKTLSKAYGELKGAEIESQKALARGLKDEIAAAVPSVSKLNERESALINALKVAERRVLMDANKNPIGLGAIAPNKAALLGFLADRNAGVKGLLARGAYQTSRAQVPLGLPSMVEQYGLLGAPSVLATSP